MNLNKIPEKLRDGKGLRIDGRKLDELRPIKFEVGVLNNAEGSAYVEQGRNKLVVGVYGPRETHPKHMIISISAPEPVNNSGGFLSFNTGISPGRK